jgi:hypothetical protein
MILVQVKTALVARGPGWNVHRRGGKSASRSPGSDWWNLRVPCGEIVVCRRNEEPAGGPAQRPELRGVFRGHLWPAGRVAVRVPARPGAGRGRRPGRLFQRCAGGPSAAITTPRPGSARSPSAARSTTTAQRAAAASPAAVRPATPLAAGWRRARRPGARSAQASRGTAGGAGPAPRCRAGGPPPAPPQGPGRDAGGPGGPAAGGRWGAAGLRGDPPARRRPSSRRRAARRPAGRRRAEDLCRPGRQRQRQADRDHRRGDRPDRSPGARLKAPVGAAGGRGGQPRPSQHVRRHHRTLPERTMRRSLDPGRPGHRGHAPRLRRTQGRRAVQPQR